VIFNFKEIFDQAVLIKKKSIFVAYFINNDGFRLNQSVIITHLAILL
jgi:hypothetical protein